MFLKNIKIHNFRSIQNAEVDFNSGLNILIGKNGAGKSNLLKYIIQNIPHALKIIGSGQQDTNIELDFTISLNEEDTGNIEITELSIYFKRERVIINEKLDFDRKLKVSRKVGSVYSYKDKTIDIGNPELLEKNNPEFEKFHDDFDAIDELRKAYISFVIPQGIQWLDKPFRCSISSDINLDFEEENRFFSVLANLENLIFSNFFFFAHTTKIDVVPDEKLNLSELKEIFFNSFEQIKRRLNLSEYLAKYAPITDIRLNENINIYRTGNKILVENLIIEFNVNNSWIPWGYLSDGTKRLFYLITECLTIQKGILLIEEPELGIHPHQLFSLMQFIKEQADYKQIIISTHSPIVLDILSPEELNRITIVKLSSNGTQFDKLTDGQIAVAKEYIEKVGDLSAYWLHSDLEL